MSPERAAETVRNEIVALFMQPASHLPPSFLGLIYFIYSYPGLRRFAAQPPGSIELSPALAGSMLGSRLRLRLGASR